MINVFLVQQHLHPSSKSCWSPFQCRRVWTIFRAKAADSRNLSQNITSSFAAVFTLLGHLLSPVHNGATKKLDGPSFHFRGWVHPTLCPLLHDCASVSKVVPQFVGVIWGTMGAYPHVFPSRQISTTHSYWVVFEQRSSRTRRGWIYPKTVILSA